VDLTVILENAIAHYYSRIQSTLDTLFVTPRSDARDQFMPGTALPRLDDQMVEYLSVSALAHAPLTEYRGYQLSLLDLSRNPATGTTKTFPSLVMVARAIEHIRESGERVTILTPSSANKAVALRDAVLRAIQSGLVAAEQLNIVVLVPAGSAYKLRSSDLSTDPELRARNPIAVFGGAEAEHVKVVARAAFDRYGTTVEKDADTHLWYTMQLENYLSGDVVRAFAEEEYFPAAPGNPRLHAQAVSSAFGLLGHAYGWEMLGGHPAGRAPGYFLVQHLGAPDMVASLYGADTQDPHPVPTYVYDSEAGIYLQDEDPHFPQGTSDPAEILDSTFYTRKPITSKLMDPLIRSQGGGGIVVSRAECLRRYDFVGSMLSEAGLSVPSDPAAIAEWSVIMAVTGVLNAVDRGLVSQPDIVVHGTGIYTHGDFLPLSGDDLHAVDDEDALRELILTATAS
jgi:Family of unknown function (DUF6002)